MNVQSNEWLMKDRINVPCLKTLTEESTEEKRQPKHIAML